MVVVRQQRDQAGLHWWTMHACDVNASSLLKASSS